MRASRWIGRRCANSRATNCGGAESPERARPSTRASRGSGCATIVFTSAMEDLSADGRHVAGRRGHAAGMNCVTLDPKVKDKNGMPVASVHFDDHPNDIAMREHAYKQGAAVYEAVGATVTYPTPPYPSTHNLGTNRMSEKPQRRRGQQVRPDPRRQEPVRLRRQPVHQRRGLQPDADDRLAGDPAGGPHRGCDAAARKSSVLPSNGSGSVRNRAEPLSFDYPINERSYSAASRMAAAPRNSGTRPALLAR